MYILISFFVIFIDQITKFIIPVISQKHYNNSGIAFGLLDKNSFNHYLIAISLLIIFIIIIKLKKLSSKNPLFILALSLFIGGAFGNIIDRLMFGHVRDFINITNLPSFNIADISIVSGLLIYAYAIIRARHHI